MKYLMDTDSLKHSLKTGAVFLLTYPIFLIFTYIDRSDDLEPVHIILFPIIFFSIIFYFLFKYQKKEYYNKSMFWKLPLTAAIIGILGVIILTVYVAYTCSGEGCLGVPFLIVLGIPVTSLIFSIIALVLSLNPWYKTNLYIVAWTIFAFVLFPVILLILMGLGVEEPIFIIPFGFLAGTLLAIYIKKTLPETKRTINRGALFGGAIVTLLAFIVLFILGEFKNLDFKHSGDVFTFLIVSSIIIVISGIIGAVIGWIITKIKSKKVD